MDLAILARDLTKTFGDLQAVDHISLEVATGRIYGFLGPNGSGKSTTIRMLCGLLTPSAGEATVLGYRMPEQAEDLRHHIGYMTQRFSLYTDLSVMENMSFMAAIYRLDGGRRQARIQDQLQHYQLWGRRDQRAGTLSGGQQQRLALAAVTLHEPELLLLDEPTSAVDPQSRRSFWQTLFELADQGTTILVSTHYMDEAERCHSLAILDEGRLAADGTPDQLKNSIDAQVLSLSVDRPQEISRILGTFDETLTVTQLGNRLQVLLKPDLPEPEKWLGNLLKQNDYTADIERTAPSLEDVFVAATRRREV